MCSFGIAGFQLNMFARHGRIRESRTSQLGLLLSKTCCTSWLGEVLKRPSEDVSKSQGANACDKLICESCVS